ncbi:MAG: hypothetical protein R6T92_06050 [Desulfosalsimonadaceae bacterium]
MAFSTKKYVAVITGDVIAFKALPASVRRCMPRVIVGAGRSFNDALGPAMPWDADVFRGDGWQALIEDPVQALRAALFFRAFIKSACTEDNVDTRMAIGIGPVDYVPPGNISAGDGAAYRASGKLLGTMNSARKGRIRCAFAHSPGIGNDILKVPPDEELIDAVVRLAGTIGDKWRSRRALAVTGALKGWPQASIAQNWPGPISRQAVGKHLQRAGWDAISHALSVFEGKMRDFVKNRANGGPENGS